MARVTAQRCFKILDERQEVMDPAVGLVVIANYVAYPIYMKEKVFLTIIFASFFVQAATSSIFLPPNKTEQEKIFHLHGKIISHENGIYKLTTKKRVFWLEQKKIDLLNDLDSTKLKNREVLKVKLSCIKDIQYVQK